MICYPPSKFFESKLFIESSMVLGLESLMGSTPLLDSLLRCLKTSIVKKVISFIPFLEVSCLFSPIKVVPLSLKEATALTLKFWLICPSVRGTLPGPRRNRDPLFGIVVVKGCPRRRRGFLISHFDIIWSLFCFLKLRIFST